MLPMPTPLHRSLPPSFPPCSLDFTYSLLPLPLLSLSDMRYGLGLALSATEKRKRRSNNLKVGAVAAALIIAL